MLISDRYWTKERGKQKQREHLDCTEATVKVTYCSVPGGYTVVIDWLTRAEWWFLSPWGMRRSLRSMLCRKKQAQQKRRTATAQSEMFLTSTLYGSPARSVGAALFITASTPRQWCESYEKVIKEEIICRNCDTQLCLFKEKCWDIFHFITEQLFCFTSL